MRVRWDWLTVLAVALTCGGACGDDDGGGDGGDGGDGNDGEQACSPLSNTGCDTGEKCTQVILSLDPFDAETVCVPDGNIPTGEACGIGAPGPDTGFDQCQVGNYCGTGICSEICDTDGNDCPVGEVCIQFEDVFDDRIDVGLCQGTCDPLAPVCDVGEGCYLVLPDGDADCQQTVPPVGEVDAATQGEACQFTNNCAPGYGCNGIEPDDASSLLCVFYCDAGLGGGPTCADGPGATYECVAISDFYGNVEGTGDIGICVECDDFPQVPVCQ